MKTHGRKAIMEERIRRWIARAAAVALVLGTVVACGSAGGSDAGAAGGGGGAGGTATSVPQVTDLVASPGATAGTVKLVFTAPEAPGGGAVDAYVIRSGVRHLTASTLPGAATHTTAAHPSPPGSRETIVVAGLEGGRVLQLAVQCVLDGTTGGIALASSARVPEAPAPAPPPGAVYLTGPATLDRAGTTYVLANDIVAAGTAFRITARDVTLDLAGRTITYGATLPDAHGVEATNVSGGTTTVRGGRIVQGAAGGARCDAVLVEGAGAVRLTRLDVTVRGPDSNGLVVGGPLTGLVRIDHNTVACRTTVVSNRHYPGVCAIRVDDAAAGVEVDQNLVTASPQWGIRLSGDAGWALVHHNRVLGTKALVANGYMIGVHQVNADVFENDLAGESRGIHVDAIDADGRFAEIHDNAIEAQDQPNPEYPTFHWAHGIKLEGAESTHVHHNRVRVVADDAHAEARALDLDVSRGRGVLVESNLVEAIARTSRYRAHALQWTAGPAAGPLDLRIERNVFVATDRCVERAWDAAAGSVLREDAWLREYSQGSTHAFVLEHFETSDTVPSRGHGLSDAWTQESLTDVSQWASPAPYESAREWTLTILVKGTSGLPVLNADVVVRDRFGVEAFRGKTGPAGVLAGRVVAMRIVNGPAFPTNGPFQVSVTATGLSPWAGSVAVAARTALHVDLASGAAATDSTAPAAAANVTALPLGSSRALLRWSAPADASGIAIYGITLNGSLVGLSTEPSFVCSGLEPGTTYAPGVFALDAGGNLSPAAAAPAFQTGAEDRGP